LDASYSRLAFGSTIIIGGGREVLKAVFRIRALSLVAVVFFGACSFSFGSKNLNTDKLETEVENGIQDQVGVAVTVDCPTDVKIEKGNEFTCTATDDQGSSRTVNVVQEDDEGNINWELAPN
jgi:hypothetical protein